MLFSFLFVTHFLLPGWLMAGILGFRRRPMLMALAFSYAWLLANLMAGRLAGASVALFTGGLRLQLALLATGAAALAWRRRRRRIRWSFWLGGAAILAGFAAYQLWVGPYLELPADPWIHYERLRAQAHGLAAGRLPPLDWRAALFQQGPHWYTLQAYLCRRAGLPVFESLGLTGWLTGSLFALGAYDFGLGLAAGLRRSRLSKTVMAAAGAGFAVLTMGISVFAFVRYYALAPVMLNSAVYLAAAGLVWDTLRSRSGFPREAAPIPVFLLVLYWVHRQEALLVFCLALMLALVLCWRAMRPAPGSLRRAWRRPPARLLAVALLLLAAYGGLFAVTRGRPRAPLSPQTVRVFPRVRIGGEPAAIVAPGGQWYQTLGLWGLWVYVLFYGSRTGARRSAFLSAGMASPLLTALNPISVDMMLRGFETSYELYRLAFLVPLPWAAGMLLVEGCGRIRRAVRSPAVRAGWLAAAAGLALLWLPLPERWVKSQTSRWTSLRPVPADNRWEWWGDLIAFMRSQSPARVIADPVAGYLIRHLTESSVVADPSQGYLKRLDPPADGGDFGDWLRDPDPARLAPQLLAALKPGQRWLLVVNRRPGGESVNGRLSGHWPADILDVFPYYSPAFEPYIAAHPDRFRLCWQADRIRVYEMVNPAIE